MAGARAQDVTGLSEDVIRSACSSAIEAHKYPNDQFRVKHSRDSPIALISFAGSSSINQWFSGANAFFGETVINKQLFPSIRSIGVDEPGQVNAAFLQRFEGILGELERKVKNLENDGKQIVFAGHSSGGPTAILATIWLLEGQRKLKNVPNSPKCVTFGSPLVGNFIFSHALRREKWSSHFIHFVMRYDIVPRIHLAPLPSLQSELVSILNSFNFKSSTIQESVLNGNEASTFFMTVLRNASAVASNTACHRMGSMNLLVDTLANFVNLSPYRPFGTYIFCTENGELVVVNNPEAVLQILFYSCQLSSERESAQVASKSLKDHWGYHSKLQHNLELLRLIRLDELSKLPLSLSGRSTPITEALNELGLSTRAMLNLRAAGAYEEQKMRNLEAIEEKVEYVEDRLTWLEEEYRAVCKVNGLGYYDSFKLHEDQKDFQANVKRLELSGVWDEIMEMLKRYELPDQFEGDEKWIQLGTRLRRLLEPIDIANYYRHSRNADGDCYMIKGRPKRYRFTQKWLEHDQKMTELSEESTLWAEVEDLVIKTRTRLFAENEEEIVELEKKMKRWINEVEDDMLLKKSTFVKWWKTLPEHHRLRSCIKEHVERAENRDEAIDSVSAGINQVVL